jgi:hypothetical protein
MTPIEKALDISMRFDKDGETDNAKKCALICVDEILDAVTTIADKKFEFYTEVKQEINKL